jgi:hypothetical protein
MATHDYVLDNQNGALFRADINAALQAIVTNNSSPTAPVPTYPFMMWVDTTTGILKQRNAANTAWINIYNYASPGIIDAVNFHTGTLLTPWTAYTPTITSSSGTITSRSATGRYKQIGKTVHVLLDINITNNGTGAGVINFTLPPLPPLNTSWIGVGRGKVDGQLMQVFNGNAIVRYDNGYPLNGASSGGIFASFTYETT